MRPPFASYTVQTWAGQELLSTVGPVSLDAAREIAATARLTGHVGRLMSESEDYCEVYDTNGWRVGTFAETTLVHVAEGSLAPWRHSS